MLYVFIDIVDSPPLISFADFVYISTRADSGISGGGGD